MDIEKALKLTKSTELWIACMEAERTSVEIGIINKLYNLYYMAVKYEGQTDKLRSIEHEKQTNLQGECI